MSGNEVLEYVRQQNSERGYRNKINGDAFEFRILRSFKARSDVVWAHRSAGSHSSIDIVIQFKNKRQLWIVCKCNSYIKPSERLELSRVKQYQPDNVEIRLYYYISPKVMKWCRI